MESIAKALLVSMAYLELWDDDVIDPDTSVAALEAISGELQSATRDEIEALSNVARSLASSSSNEDEREFYEDFIESFIDE